MIIISFFAWLILFAIIAFLLAKKRTNSTDFFFITWIAMIMAPLCITPFYFYQKSGIVFLTIYVTVGISTFLILKASKNQVHSNKEKNNFNLPKKKPNILIELSIISTLLVGIIGEILVNGTLLNLDALMTLSKENASLRYSGDLELTYTQALLLSLMYASFGIKGYQSVKYKNWLKYNFLLIYMPLTIFYATILNSKALILYSAIFFIAFRLGFYLEHRNQRDLNKELTTIIKAVPLIYITLFIIFILIGSVRYNIDYYKDIVNIFHEYNSYSFGYISGFTYWFDEYLTSTQKDLYFGTQTLQGIFKIIQIDVASNYQNVPRLIWHNTYTNVDSALKDYISDFGIITSILATPLILITISFLEKNFRKTYFTGIIISFFFLNILWFFVNPIFSYSTTVIAFILVSIYITLNKNVKINNIFKKSEHHSSLKNN